MTYKNVSPEDKAYFAGLFDGEGTVGVYSRSDGNGFASITNITNTNKIPLEELVSIFGGKISSRDDASKNWKLLYSWKIYGESQILFLKMILPYLRIKTKQVLLFLEYKKMSGKGIRYTPESLEKVNNICLELKSLKKEAIQV